MGRYSTKAKQLSLRDHANCNLIAGILILLVFSVTQSPASGELPPRPPAMVNQISQTDLTVATVNDYAIKSWKVDYHARSLYLSREEAMEDLIDLHLLQQAAISNQVPLPEDGWDEQSRSQVELALVQALALELPPPRVSLILDHAWLKDAEDEATLLEGRKQMKRLRELVVKGVSMPSSYKRLQADGSLWHIGDHEEYGYEIISAGARDLPEGGLSEILPGDGGLHLFKIHQRKTAPATIKEIRGLLNLRLRSTAEIVYPIMLSGEQPE